MSEFHTTTAAILRSAAAERAGRVREQLGGGREKKAIEYSAAIFAMAEALTNMLMAFDLTKEEPVIADKLPRYRKKDAVEQTLESARGCHASLSAEAVRLEKVATIHRNDRPNRALLTSGSDMVEACRRLLVANIYPLSEQEAECASAAATIVKEVRYFLFTGRSR